MNHPDNRWDAPADWGLDPARFKSWRSAQLQAFDFYFDNPDARILGFNMPTGSGKTPFYAALMHDVQENDGSSAVVTVTKQLQAQILREFPFIRDIRGRANYDCLNFSNCQVGNDAACGARRNGMCTYQQAYLQAVRSPSVSTNTAYWLAVGKVPTQLNYTRPNLIGPNEKSVPRDLLVLDEAHDLVDSLTDELSSTFGAEEGPEGPDRERVESWARWAGERLGAIEEELEAGPDLLGTKIYVALKEKARRMARCAGADADRFVIDAYEGRVTISPIWPAEFAEDVLFRDAARIILMSGTLSPADMKIIGAEGDDVVYHDQPSDFSPDNWRIYDQPVGRIDMRSGRGLIRGWLERHNQIVKRRPNSKVVIHSVSYSRAAQIAAAIDDQTRVLLHRPGQNTERLVEQFKQARYPAVLISPSVYAGVDFPYGECTVVIVSKLPRMDTRPVRNLMKERRKRFPNYERHQMMKVWRQQVGRGMRKPDDFCEVFVLDGHFGYNFRGCLGDTIPKSFRKYVRTTPIIPADPDVGFSLVN